MKRLLSYFARSLIQLAYRSWTSCAAGEGVYVIYRPRYADRSPMSRSNFACFGMLDSPRLVEMVSSFTTTWMLRDWSDCWRSFSDRLPLLSEDVRVNVLPAR